MFRYSSALAGNDQRMRFKEGALTNGQTIAPGQVAKLVNGRWSPAVSGDVIDGVMEGLASLTGNAAGTVVGYFRLVRGSEFEVGQNSITATSCEPGDMLDIAVGGLLPDGTVVNEDLRVTRRDVARALLYVEFLNPGI